MYKSSFIRKAFIKARVAQLVEHRATNLKVLGLSPTVSKNFSFCILSLSTFDALLAGRLVIYK